MNKLVLLSIALCLSVHTFCQDAYQNTATKNEGACAPGCGAYGPPFEANTYSVGGNVSAPTLIHTVDPTLSEEARGAHYGGDCPLKIIVGANGEVSRAVVIRMLGMGLDEKAVEAVKQYRYKPAMLHGKAVPVHITVIVKFSAQSTP